MSSPLVLTVSGPPEISIDGQPRPLRSRRAIALLVYAAVEGRAVPRSTLAELLWGPGRLVNLRQELSRLRRLPGSEAWLDATDGVSVDARIVDDPQRGPFLEGFDDVGTPAFQDWILSRRSGASSGLAEGLQRLLALEPDLPPSVAARLLEASPVALASTWEELRRGGDLGESGLRPTLAEAVRADLGGAAALLHQAIAEAWHDAPAVRRAWHLQQCGQGDAAARAWLDLGRSTGDALALQRAEELAGDDALRARVFETRFEQARLRRDLAGAGAALEALRTLAIRTQDADALAQAAHLGAIHASDTSDAGSLRRRLAELDELGDSGGAPALAALVRGALCLRAGDRAGARAAAERVRALGEGGVRVKAAQILASLDAANGDMERALERQRHALAEARNVGEMPIIAVALINLASTEDRLHRIDGAAERLDELLALLGPHMPGLTAVLARSNRGCVARRRGEYGRLREMANALLETSDTASRQRAYALRGDLEVDVGRWEEAVRWYTRALDEVEADAQRQALLQLSAELARGPAPGEPPELERAVNALDTHSFPEERRVGWLDVGLHAGDRAWVERALEVAVALGTPPEERFGIEVRLGIVSDALRARLDAPGWGAWRPMLVAAATVAWVDGSAELAARARALTAERSRGLLPAQREALEDQVETWLQGGAVVA